jgi:hypothetical protein
MALTTIERIVEDGLERIYTALDEFARSNKIEDADMLYYLQRNWPVIDLTEDYKEWIGAAD